MCLFDLCAAHALFLLHIFLATFATRNRLTKMGESINVLLAIGIGVIGATRR